MIGGERRCFMKNKSIWIPLVLTIAFALAACGNGEKQPDPTAFSDDEQYLIDMYAKIQHARSYYPHRPAIAESLFVQLDASVDSTRIAVTVKELNQKPDRWVYIFREIEDRLRLLQEQDLEHSG